ncbi:unnamed protein product, partial [Rotaria sordida]
ELRHLIPPTIGIIVKSSSFFSSLHQYDGLVPDHPEVKKVMPIFTKIAEHEHVEKLQEFYHTLCLWFIC